MKTTILEGLWQLLWSVAWAGCALGACGTTEGLLFTAELYDVR